MLHAYALDVVLEKSREHVFLKSRMAGGVPRN